MMGLRLRYQISGFLLILFSVVVLIMGYFNISILNDQLRRLSLQQTENTANNVFSFLDNTIPRKDGSLDDFIRDNTVFNEFQKFVLGIEPLRNIELYSPEGKLLYSKLSREDIKMDNQAILKEVLLKGIGISRVWAVDLTDKHVTEIESYGVLDARPILADYYYPIIRMGEIIGIAHLSIRLEKTSRMMKFFFIGNLSLSLVFILTASIAIYVWSENAINRPFRNLLRAQNQLSHGDFDAHVEIALPANNELGIISNSFNRMAGELKAYKEELEEKSSKLEQLNEQYRHLNENLEQQVEEKTRELTEFFSLITHDLKIPLAAVKGYVSLLKKEKTGPLNEKQETFVNAIEKSTISLLHMVKNMLDSVRYDAGKVSYFMENFDLPELVKEIESQTRPTIDEREIDFIVDIPVECRRVYGDRGKIGQVISNILSNAIEYVPVGGRIILAARDTGGLVEVMIRDNGPGISQEQLTLIFDKFKQIPGKESPSTSLGLGLYIVRKIMEGHNMKTWATSREGGGSEFYFNLQRAMSEKKS